MKRKFSLFVVYLRVKTLMDTMARSILITAA